MRSSVFGLVVALSSLLALTSLVTAELCAPPAAVRVAFVLQATGRTSQTAHPFQDGPSGKDRQLQFAFANSLIAGINNLNTKRTGSTRDTTATYPGFGVRTFYQNDAASQTTRAAGTTPIAYQFNQASIIEYASGTSISSTTTKTYFLMDQSEPKSYSNAGDNLLNWSTATGRTPNLAAGINAAVTALSASDDGLYPHPSTVRIMVIVNDGQAYTSSGSTTSVSSTNNAFNAARCAVNAAIDSGVHVIYVHSKRNFLPSQPDHPSLASTNKQRGNSQSSIYNSLPDTPNQNDGNILPLDFIFDDFSELMTDKVLHPVSAAIRNLAAPGRAAAPACVVSGDPHFTTFDGLHFDYQGVGDYWLFRSLRLTDPLSVQYRAGPCATGSACALGAAISDGIDRVEVVIADRTGNPKNAYLTYNGAKLPLTDFISRDPNTWSAAQRFFPNVNISVSLLGSSSYAVTVRYAAGHTLKVQKNLILLQPAPHLHGRSAGLCGNWNGCPADDLLDSCGKVGVVNTSDPLAASRFGDSWTVAAGESLFSSAPSQGVAAWEVSNNQVCPFDPAAWLVTPQYTRWPFLPSQVRDYTATQAATPAISLFGTPSIDTPNSAANNRGLINLKNPRITSAFQVPTQCARLRGALQQDCIADYSQSPDLADASYEVVWQACVNFCKTGRMFTNLVTPSDCIAAQICSLGSTTPDLHKDYVRGILPDVSFGNPNSPTTFFQPTLGLSGRYLLEVQEADLCGVSKKFQAVDINCATETPQVVLSFPGLNAPATQPTTTDPMVVAITSVNPDRFAGYPIVTIQANVFPQATLLGHSWKLVSYPSKNAFDEDVSAPELDGATASRTVQDPVSRVAEYQ